MKDDNVLVNANTNTGTSRELKLSFTIEHMTLLLMVYDGMRQIENNLLQITGNLDNTDPESALGKLAMIDSLLEQLSPLYSSITPSGKKMSSLDWRMKTTCIHVYSTILETNMKNAHEILCAVRP